MFKHRRKTTDVKEPNGIIASRLQSNFLDGSANAFDALLTHVITICADMLYICAVRDNDLISEGHITRCDKNGLPDTVFSG